MRIPLLQARLRRLAYASHALSRVSGHFGRWWAIAVLSSILSEREPRTGVHLVIVLIMLLQTTPASITLLTHQAWVTILVWCRVVTVGSRWAAVIRNCLQTTSFEFRLNQRDNSCVELLEIKIAYKNSNHEKKCIIILFSSSCYDHPNSGMKNTRQFSKSSN